MGIVKTYLVLSLIYGLLGVFDNIISQVGIPGPAYYLLMIMITLMFLLFNIILIPIFHYQREARIMYVLPAYYIISFLAFLGLGLVFSAASTFNTILFASLQGVASLFEIILSLYLLKKQFIATEVAHAATIHTSHLPLRKA